ncbi:hypothetical protein [Actinomadura oligospora]|uniref:hypothetical protein n=1 Tax=Actinomadura oligospora TaxID=111804 RepID=UPI00047BBD55|nr:hypothetical protein [Actinomadura oligospora]
MTRDEPAEGRTFLDIFARALAEVDDDIWRFQILPGGPTLVARTSLNIDQAVFQDAQQTPIATFAGLSAELAWHEEPEVSPWGSSWGSSHFDLPAGTTMTIPNQPPLPVTGVTLRFHKETRPLQATQEENAFADLASLWLWG